MPENGRSIGGFDVDSRWVHPVQSKNRMIVAEIEEAWKVKHMLRSRYLVMYTKCDDPACCSPCRSHIKSRLPSGFLPAPRVYTHNADGELELMKPGDVDKTVKFASLSNILSQPVQQNLLFDTFNLKVDIDQQVCPFCSMSLCSRAELQRHRRAIHFRQRAPGHEPFELKEFSNVDTVRENIDRNGDEYLCITEDDEDLEWRRLAPSHPLISIFEKERARLLQGVIGGPEEIPSSELGDFMSSVLEDI